MSPWRLWAFRGCYGFLALVALESCIGCALAPLMGLLALSAREPAMLPVDALGFGIVTAIVGIGSLWVVVCVGGRLVCQFRYSEGRLTYTTVLPGSRSRDLADVASVKVRKKRGQAFIMFRSGGQVEIVFKWLAHGRELAERLGEDCKRKAPSV